MPQLNLLQATPNIQTVILHNNNPKYKTKPNILANNKYLFIQIIHYILFIHHAQAHIHKHFLKSLKMRNQSPTNHYHQT